MNQRKIGKQIINAVESSFIIISAYLLAGGTSAKETFILFAALGLFYTWKKREAKLEGAKLWFSVFVALIPAVLCALAVTDTVALIKIPLVFVGSFLSWLNLLWGLCDSRHKRSDGFSHIKPVIAFWIPFAVIVVIDIAILIICSYPGEVDPDLIGVLYSIKGMAKYTNQHSVYCTYLIQLCIIIGEAVFNSLEAGLFIFCIFEILFLAFCISYCLNALAEYGINKVVWHLVAIWFIFMPVNISYSFFISKDVLFSGCMLLLVSSYFKITQIRKKYFCPDMMLLCFSLLGVCIFRGNGFYVGVVWTLILLCTLKKRKEGIKVAFSLVLVILVAMLLRGPMLTLLDVEKNRDCLEGIGVPIQQISRVIRDCDDISESEYELLSNIVDVSQVPYTFVPYWCDFSKDLIRQHGGEAYIEAHKAEVLKLYISLGIRHPLTYAVAWWDEVKSYMFPTASRFVWKFGVTDMLSEYVTASVLSETVNNLFQRYCYLFTHLYGLKMFTCICLYVWLGVAVFSSALINKDRTKTMMCLLPLLLWGTLLIGAPLDGEFRYAYPAVLSLIPVFAVAKCKLDD